MGFFSWKTCDTHKSISNCYSNRGALPVYMVAPDGRYWEEGAYEGYGVFGGRDFYGLVAELNGLGKPEQAVYEPDEGEDAREFPVTEEDKQAFIFQKQAYLDEDFDNKMRIAGIKLCDVNNHDAAPPGVILPRFCEKLVPWETLADPENCRCQGYFYGSSKARIVEALTDAGV